MAKGLELTFIHRRHTNKWSISTGKYAQHHWSLGKLQIKMLMRSSSIHQGGCYLKQKKKITM